MNNHLPYSPDIDPADFFLLPKLKITTIWKPFGRRLGDPKFCDTGFGNYYRSFPAAIVVHFVYKEVIITLKIK